MRTIELNAVAMPADILEINGQKQWIVYGLVDGISTRVIIHIGGAMERCVLKETAMELPCA